MAGPHSGWPYPTGDPNKPEEEIDYEAALAYQKWRRGADVDDLAKELGISRRTLYYRLDRLRTDEGLPTRQLQRTAELDRLEDYTRMVIQRLTTSEVSNADFARLIGEARQLSRERRALLKLDDGELPKPPDPGLSDQDRRDLADWEAAEAGDEPL